MTWPASICGEMALFASAANSVSNTIIVVSRHVSRCPGRIDDRQISLWHELQRARRLATAAAAAAMALRRDSTR
jgi:hypothetical protein